jgi:ankyrin repeat protein
VSRTESALGRLQNVVKLIKLGRQHVDLDAPDPKTSRTALYLAAEKGYIDIINALITAGANVNVTAPQSNNRTPLHIACKSGHVEVAEALLDAGADMELRTSLGYTAMHLAALNNRPKIAKLLISRDADLNAKDAGKCTPLYLSAQEGRSSVFVEKSPQWVSERVAFSASETHSPPVLFHTGQFFPYLVFQNALSIY